MNETTTTTEWNDSEPQPVSDAPAVETPKKRILNLETWEIAALVISVLLIALIAVPNYFGALGALRGRECSDRLTLLAQILQDFASQNQTKPGEQICELFDLNEELERRQGGSLFLNTNDELPAYYKAGAEPDCADPSGDHKFDMSLILGADGKIVPPTCTLGEGPEGESNREQGLHVCKMDEVVVPTASAPAAESAPANVAVPAATQ